MKTLEITNTDEFTPLHLVADFATLIGTYDKVRLGWAGVTAAEARVEFAMLALRPAGQACMEGPLCVVETQAA